jgi:predicted transcriptional regulator
MTATAQKHKLWLLERIAAEQNEETLAQMEAALSSLIESTTPDTPSEAVLAAVARGRADREAGRVVTHEAFMAAFDRGLAAGIEARK